jgi:hypothetical protein
MVGMNDDGRHDVTNARAVLCERRRPARRAVGVPVLNIRIYEQPVPSWFAMVTWPF